MATNPDRSSYFPAIEKKTGLPMKHWFAVMDEISDLKYAEQIAYLRENHGFSQTHANALVLYSRGSTSSRKFNTFAEYLKTINADQQKTVKAIFKGLQTKYPKAELVIAWNQPMLKLDGKYLFGVSATKGYLLLSPLSGAIIEAFTPKLDGYKVNKKTIQIPSDWNVDSKLLNAMVAARIKEVS